MLNGTCMSQDHELPAIGSCIEDCSTETSQSKATGSRGQHSVNMLPLPLQLRATVGTEHHLMPRSIC